MLQRFKHLGAGSITGSGATARCTPPCAPRTDRRSGRRPDMSKSIFTIDRLYRLIKPEKRAGAAAMGSPRSKQRRFPLRLLKALVSRVNLRPYRWQPEPLGRSSSKKPRPNRHGQPGRPRPFCGRSPFSKLPTLCPALTLIQPPLLKQNEPIYISSVLSNILPVFSRFCPVMVSMRTMYCTHQKNM